jgi:glycosyltransferase 2 family protein
MLAMLHLSNFHLEKRFSTSWMRIFGILLFVYLLYRFNTLEIFKILLSVEWVKILIALFMIFPLIALKTIRWQLLLRAQSIKFNFSPAILAYFSSLFIGFLTPGRVGEFSKAFYVSQELGVSNVRAFSSVLLDRLFDFGCLLVIGSISVAALPIANWNKLFISLGLWLPIVVMVVLFHPNSGNLIDRVQKLIQFYGDIVSKIFSYLFEVVLNLRLLTYRSFLSALFITIVSYLIFFGQCFLLARSLEIPLNFFHVSFAVTLGSLVTLLPVSISGIGTREAVIVWYFSFLEITPETSLSFSLLLFAVFFIGGGMIGFLSWLIKPIDFHKSPTTTYPI